MDIQKFDKSRFDKYKVGVQEDLSASEIEGYTKMDLFIEPLISIKLGYKIAEFIAGRIPMISHKEGTEVSFKREFYVLTREELIREINRGTT